MTNRARAVSLLVATSVVAALGGCGGGGGSESSADDTGSGGRPPCSDWANGEKITEQLSLSGCADEATSVNASTACTDAAGDVQRLIAVGPVYGVVGGKAMYLGAGKDASKSAEWEKLKQDCPAPT